MSSKYVQLTNLSVINDIPSSAVFLISRGNWTSDNRESGDIFTSLSSYGIRYNELSNNLMHSITQSKDEISVKNGNNTIWDFTADDSLRVATNGPLSSIGNDSAVLTAAINFETCRALSSDAWWQVQRTCFDAARAREMSGVANRMLMEKGDKGRLAANKYGMAALVYDILNRHWLASDYFARENVLTCVNEINKEKTEVTIIDSVRAGIRSDLYGVCPFKHWSTLPFEYYDQANDITFAVGNKDTLSGFINKCFMSNGKAISYSLIKFLDELSDLRMNIDMSIYDQNRFSSLSGSSFPGELSTFNTTVNGRTYTVPYRTLEVAFPPDFSTITKDTALSNIEDPSSYGPTYMGNAYLYPVFEPYKLPLWDYWKDGSTANYVYQSEPNPCGSKTTYVTLDAEYDSGILFNPQQALWEYHKYYALVNKTETDALPGDMIHFFEKFCKVQICFESDKDIDPDCLITMQYDKPPRAYMLSPSRRHDKEIVSITYENNLVNTRQMRTEPILIAGNEPTHFQFKHSADVNDSKWRIWIDAMWVW